MKIDDIRKKIDSIDKNILNLLNKRAKVVKQIAAMKIKEGKDFYVPHREKKILANLINGNKGILPKEAIESIFREILNASRSIQTNIRVAYLGPEATFTHQAALKNFGVGAEYIPAKSIGDVFLEVEKNRAKYGVVPIENSTEGVVNHTLDMFMESELVICAELSMPIEQCLLSKVNKSSIKRIYSHPQALVQCRSWLEENYPNVPVIETSSTAEAAQKASNERNTAAIASRAAAALYRLDIIEHGIEDSMENFTRFLVIGRTPAQKSGSDKTSIMFSIKDRVGALHDMLIPFKKNKVNLTKIESRPTKKKAWEYIFFVDFNGHISERKVKDAVDALAKNCVFLKVLGSYPRSE